MRPVNAGASNLPAAAPAVPGAASSGAGWRILKFFAALALIPACVGLTLGVHDHFMSVWPKMNLAMLGPGPLVTWFAIGAVVFAVLAILLWRPVVLYVFAHELVHALATWLCLGRVTNLAASARGGQVTTSKSNTFIRLAPYCVPFYALLAAAVYLALDAWWQPLGAYSQWLAATLGFFYAFHIGFTLWSLRRNQPDLKPDGWLFSLVMIYVGNVVVFLVLMGFLAAGHPRGAWSALQDCAVLGWRHSANIYHNLSLMCQQLINR
ncbi:MAG: hypothetical protein NTW87_29335 [Planctomycetota bacterium]|nr:hypothetical protein [Planctomycetota bacterium]